MRLIVVGAFLLLAPALAPAQELDHAYRGQGYIFFGLGASAQNEHPLFEYVGGGGEAFFYKGLAFGAETEYVHHDGLKLENPTDGVDLMPGGEAWIGSADFSYHFGRHAARGKVDPFLLGGFSLVGPTAAGGGRGSPAGNFGGGANWWLARHAGLRFEFRDVVGSNFWVYDHVLSFRVGVTFR